MQDFTDRLSLPVLGSYPQLVYASLRHSSVDEDHPSKVLPCRLSIRVECEHRLFRGLDSHMPSRVSPIRGPHSSWIRIQLRSRIVDSTRTGVLDHVSI